MLDGCGTSKNTVGFSTCLPTRGTEVCVVAACWPTMFTTNMGGVGMLVTGESTTGAFDVFVESVTHLGTERIEDEDL